MSSSKRPLAFLLGITENLGFAAGNVALSLNKYMPDDDYDVLIYYTSLQEGDRLALQKIPKVRLVPFSLPKPFTDLMLARLPRESRFRDLNHLMCFCHFEAFALLSQYRTVAWLDADIAIQASLANIVNFAPFGITSDTPWPVQMNFTQPIDSFEMTIPGMCTAVMVAHDTLPYEDIYKWCYDKAVEYAEFLVNPDQGIINLALQAFQVTPNEMPFEEWQCISWRDQASTARIVHFGTGKKVWTAPNVLNSFPEWYRVHLQWLQLGGADFDRRQVRISSPVAALNEYDVLRAKEWKAPVPGRTKPVSRFKEIRRRVRKALFGERNRRKKSATVVPSDRPSVAFRLRGGIGDHLIAARFIRDLLAEVEGLEFDLFSSRPQTAQWVFSRLPGLRRVRNEHLEWDRSYHEYSLPVFVQQYVYLFLDKADCRLALQKHPKLAKICESIERNRHLIAAHIESQPHSDNFMSQQAVLRGWNRYNVAHNMAGLRYGGHKLPLDTDQCVIAKYDLSRHPYITVHNASDENFMVGNMRMGDRESTKVYPHFGRLVEMLRLRVPGIRIAHLGAGNSRPIPGADWDLRGRCSIEQTGAVLANSRLHIDVESGLVHLAASLGVKACVLFGPTSIDYFGYSGNINIPPATCGNCWWLTPDWMMHCARGYRVPKCLGDTAPEKVIERLLPELHRIFAPEQIDAE